MTCIVADAGPLIALAKLDLLGLPARAFERTLVPALVFGECTLQPHSSDASAIRAACEAGVINVVADPAVPASVQDLALDAGERAALALAVNLDAPVLMDERFGRGAAQRLGVRVVGTCGLLLIGRREGWVDAPLGALIDRLQAAGYFIAPSLRAAVLAAAGEA